MEISWVLFNQKNGSDAGIRSPEECYIYTTEKEKELLKKMILTQKRCYFIVPSNQQLMSTVKVLNNK